MNNTGMIKRRRCKAVLYAAAIAAAVIGPTAVSAHERPKDVIVEVKGLSSDGQRQVLHADLNLTLRADQKILASRIAAAARTMCSKLNPSFAPDSRACTIQAISSTDGQVAAAMDRAVRVAAGEPVGSPIAITMVTTDRR